jgi:hypothetical protein
MYIRVLILTVVAIGFFPFHLAKAHSQIGCATTAAMNKFCSAATEISYLLHGHIHPTERWA